MDKKTYDHLRYLANKEKRKAQVAKYRNDHPEVVEKSKQAFYERNPNYSTLKMREFREKNPHYDKKYRSLNLETIRRSERESKRRSIKNPEAIRATSANRRARMRNAPGKHTAADIRAQYEIQNGLCHWCGKAVGDKFHVDHVIAISRGGANSPDNLVISCSTCNLSKGAKLPQEWQGVQS